MRNDALNEGGSAARCYFHSVFESVIPDPGTEGLKRAARVLFTVAAMTTLGTILLGILSIATGEVAIRRAAIVVNFAFAALAVLAGRGIEQQRNWARWLGFALGALELFNIPVGTVTGIFTIVYLARASRAGLFRSR